MSKLNNQGGILRTILVHIDDTIASTGDSQYARDLAWIRLRVMANIAKDNWQLCHQNREYSNKEASHG